MAAGHVIQPRTYYAVFATLIVLTVVTVGLDILAKNNVMSMGPVQVPVAFLIATVKASLVILFFMHVWYSTRLTWVVALSGLLWLGILIAYTVTDYMTRQWVHTPGH